VDKVIVPYVKDDEHNGPKYIRIGAYSHIHLTASNEVANADIIEGETNAQKIQNSK